MEIPSEILEQIADNTRPTTEEHMLIVMDKSTHEEQLSQPLQTKNKQFIIAVTFLTGNNGFFNVTNSKNNIYFKKTITDGDDFIQITIPPGSYQIESLNYEIKRIIIAEENFTESGCPLQIKPKSNQNRTFISLIQISRQGPIISFVFDDSIRNLLGLHETLL